MRVRRVVSALLIALGAAAPVAAQSSDGRISLNAAVGPSFANVGTTFSTTADLDVKLNDRTAVVGEFGVVPRAPFRDASEIAAPIAASSGARVNAYHWNGNLKVRPFETRRFAPYVTGGVGSFTSDTVMNEVTIGTTHFEDRRSATDFATNVGAGLSYQINDWVGIGADYRTFFVHRDESTPRVHRLSTGLRFAIPPRPGREDQPHRRYSWYGSRSLLLHFAPRKSSSSRSWPVRNTGSNPPASWPAPDSGSSLSSDRRSIVGMVNHTTATSTNATTTAIQMK